MRLKDFFRLVKCSVSGWQDDYASSMGAAIAFYTVFSIAPLIIIVIAVAGFVWGEDAVRGEILHQLSGIVGRDAAAGVQSMIKSASQPAQGLTATIVSAVILIWGSTQVFAELQSALDRIWKVPAEVRRSGIFNTLRSRVLSFGVVLGLAFLLLVSLIVSAGLAALGQWTGGFFPGWELVLQCLNTLASVVVTTVLFAMIFKFMPQAKIAWHDVWVGALVTAVLFEVGKVLIGMYVGKSSAISALTAAGSLVVVLIWVYYAAQVFLLGAEFTWFYANHYGSRRPENDKQGNKLA
ncbi:YihY/virulence factor BrkB family protein [Eoetvoesiella caeni]|uniref:Membrane protein n=1 Tax=Eoetvoesiella caeni TaxID=645616 RepID=A0A366H162_9BURK|nr:YihY/virulence factor BrkB family protein [Eoetvoesiella caeni]MCI2810876.1 YihY/virulence factor BrkB family protein [Eoetvoesiella caeni]NYT56825.1 YihY/virulence factor BrkB family protein [Eoetvoesiella caeni]RBP35623.1 membrane protein [Eoetvoesiella caeni]